MLCLCVGFPGSKLNPTHVSSLPAGVGASAPASVPRSAIFQEANGKLGLTKGNAMRILVVEDEPAIAGGLQRGLEAEGYSVDVASDGLDGLWMARENPYVVILLDIMLPGMNGYKICQTLREEEIWTPILMLTAKEGEYDHAEGLDTGADDYLTKPFSLPILTAHIRALIRRNGYERPSILAIDDLTLDPASRQCRRGEHQVELTPREFAILYFLMRMPGQVADKREILAGVWDDEFEGDPNIVEVYVGRLRRKIDAPFGRSNLKTVRGAGYRMARDPGNETAELEPSKSTP